MYPSVPGWRLALIARLYRPAYCLESAIGDGEGFAIELGCVARLAIGAAAIGAG
jgi:hypothetical protein